MIFADALTLDAPRMTSDGYMAVRARAARSGLYDYLGAEIDPAGTKFKPTETVKVFRAADEVFAADSVRSFIMKPITDGHPTKPVTADNWSSVAKGVVGGAIRDGDYVAFDLVLMDAALIAEVRAGKRELSNGYAADIKFVDGVHEGVAYQAIQSGIRGNHVAVVPQGRAGSECRIADGAALCDSAPDRNIFSGDRKPMKTIVHDGITIEFPDQAADAYNALAKKLADGAASIAKLTAELAARDAAIGKAEAERDAFKAKIIDGAALDAAVAKRADLIAAAKSICDGDYTGKSDAEIRKAVVSLKLGDAAVAGKSEAYIDARFDILVEDAKQDVGLRQTIGAGFGNVQAGTYAATVAASKKMADSFNDWRNPAKEH